MAPPPSTLRIWHAILVPSRDKRLVPLQKPGPLSTLAKEPCHAVATAAALCPIVPGKKFKSAVRQCTGQDCGHFEGCSCCSISHGGLIVQSFSGPSWKRPKFSSAPPLK